MDVIGVRITRSSAAVRRCACGGTVGPTGECDACRQKRLRAESPQFAPPIVHDVLRSPGRPLQADVREEMEGRLGFDFSRVRVHADSHAAESAHAVGARAYAVGHDVVFGTAQFAPATHSGRRLLAHELAHVIQHQSTAPLTGGGLRIDQPGDSGEQEADAVAAAATRAPIPTGKASAPVAVDRLTPRAPIVARQKKPAAAAAPCAVDCTDPAFLALSPADREAQLNTQCPQGFPAAGETFFGKAIPSDANNATLRSKLHEAESQAMGAMCIAGRDPHALVLPGIIKTYKGHSPSQAKAVDIDASGQPYLMHEKSRVHPEDAASTERAIETEIDEGTKEVLHRIAFWSGYRKSIIPAGITSVSRPKGTSDSQRSWTNPNTGVTEPITTGELFDLLSEESTWMRQYFNLLLESDADLTVAVKAFLAMNAESPASLTKRGLPADESDASVKTFRRRIADDYRLLGGTRDRLAAFAGPTPSTAPPAVLSKAAPGDPAHSWGDRPFEGRKPEAGFLTLPREVLVALTDVGLTWGAVDFSGESGDIMHVDCRGLPGC